LVKKGQTTENHQNLTFSVAKISATIQHRALVFSPRGLIFGGEYFKKNVT
jgi:hypothetical protein